MSNKTLILIILLIIATSLMLILALKQEFTLPQPQQTIITVIPTPSIEQTSLLFGDLTPSTGSAYLLPIKIKTGTNIVTAVQLELLYDPKTITNVAVKQESFFTNPIILINKIDKNSGRVSFALGASPNESGKSGEGVVATISFMSKSKTPTQTSISFLPKTQVSAEGVSQSVLKTTNTANFIIVSNDSPRR